MDSTTILGQEDICTSKEHPLNFHLGLFAYKTWISIGIQLATTVEEDHEASIWLSGGVRLEKDAARHNKLLKRNGKLTETW